VRGSEQGNTPVSSARGMASEQHGAAVERLEEGSTPLAPLHQAPSA